MYYIVRRNKTLRVYQNKRKLIKQLKYDLRWSYHHPEDEEIIIVPDEVETINVLKFLAEEDNCGEDTSSM